MTRDENGVTTLYNFFVTHFYIIVIYEVTADFKVAADFKVTADLKAELAHTLLSHTGQSQQIDGGCQWSLFTSCTGATPVIKVSRCVTGAIKAS